MEISKKERIMNHLIGGDFFLSHFKKEILLNSDLKTKEAFLKRRHRLYGLLVGIIVVWIFVVPLFKPTPVPAPEPQRYNVDAGVIKNIQLHDTTFSEDTTITTSTGVYQVNGGVSAKVGDTVILKKWDDVPEHKKHLPMYATEVCVDSKIKKGCYRLM